MYATLLKRRGINREVGRGAEWRISNYTYHMTCRYLLAMRLHS
jgi:hypothetical protein